MKIVDILNEGLIKVPNNAINDVFLVACSDIFSRIFTYLDHAKNQDKAFEIRQIFKRIYKKYNSKFGEIQLLQDLGPEDSTTKRIRFNLADVDKNYLKFRNKKPNISYAIDVSAMLSFHAPKYISSEDGAFNMDEPLGLYVGKKVGSVPKIYLFIPEKLLIQRLHHPEFFDAFMETVYAVAEHELEHAIQDLVLNTLNDDDKKQKSDGSNGDQPDNKSEFDEYHLSDIEFSPLSKTYLRSFTSYMKDLKVGNVRLSDEQKKELLKAFLDPDYELDDDLKKYRVVNSMFDSLKRKDFPKWKKAVKYVYGLLNDPNFKFEV